MPRLPTETERPREPEPTAATSVLEALELGVLVEDGERNRLLANPAFTDMFKAGPPPLRPGTAELTLPDGRVVESSHRPVPLDGAATGSLWTFRDVTAEVAARREMAEQSQRLAEFKARFIACASHELRTPLTTLSTLGQLIGEAPVSEEELASTAEAIQRNVERMLRLVDDLTLLARIESGDLPLEPTPVDPARLVRETGERLGRLLPRVPLRVTAGPGPLLNGDEPLLRQLLYAAAGVVAVTQGAARIGTRADQNGWTITASAPLETPLSDEYLLASALPTLDASARRRSAALWLLIANAIAVRHGGRLSSTAKPGSGVRITIRLPLL